MEKEEIRKRALRWWSTFNHSLSGYSLTIIDRYAKGKTYLTITPEEIEFIYLKEATEAKEFILK